MILISSNANNLRAALANHSRTATVEAEYGDDCVMGSVATLAHHGPRSGNLCPCLHPNFVWDGDGTTCDAIDAIGISHLDLDTLGGILAIQGQKPLAPSFWDAAAAVDTKGPHRLGEILDEAPDADRVSLQLHAYWAYSARNRVFPARDGSVSDVTAEVGAAAVALAAILAGDAALLAAGAAFRDAGALRAEQSFVAVYGDVLFREKSPAGGAFVNDLYLHDGQVYAAVVGYDDSASPPGGAVTLSFEHDFGLHAGQILKDRFGAEAGGHAGIGGSPRGAPVSVWDAKAFARHVADLVAAPLRTPRSASQA